MKRAIGPTRAFLKNFNKLAVTTNRSLFTTAKRTTSGLQLEWESPREIIFNALVGQQKRGYAPASQLTGNEDCWNCKEHTDDAMMCKKCGHLQDVKIKVNYFDLLQFPQSFAIDMGELTKRFRQLQTIVHPDKFSNSSSREQTNSADWSSLINKAYKTLLTPIERAQYLLKLNGRTIPQDNSALDKEFLMEMMERNEEVEEAVTKQELDNINESLSKELQQKIERLTKLFKDSDLDAATSVMVEMKYLLSIQKTIKNKLQSLMVS